ncbi:hypothetical protein LINPERHAP1_LOCUS7142, partial [Linum perenne]
NILSPSSPLSPLSPTSLPLLLSTYPNPSSQSVKSNQVFGVSGYGKAAHVEWQERVFLVVAVGHVDLDELELDLLLV